MKLSQIGRIPRLAGLPPVEVRHETLQFKVLSTRSSQSKCVSHKNHKLRLKGLHQVQLGPPAVTNQGDKAQTDLRNNVQLVINVTEQQRLEMSQSQADRPRRGRPAPTCLR